MYGIGRQGEVVIAIIMCVIKPSALLAIRITVEHDDGTGCAPIVCTLGIVIRYGFIHPEAYFPICYSQMSHAHTTPTTSRSRLGKLVGYFLRVRVSASSGLICIFVWNLTFQFRHIVVIFLLSTFLVVACACVCVCLFVYVDVRLLLSLVFRIWFPLIGAIIAIQSSLWAFKVFSAC